MKILPFFGVLAFGCASSATVACSLDGEPGGRYSPFYALAHSSVGSGQSPASTDSADTRSTQADSDTRARGNDGSSVDSGQEQPSQSGTTPDWGPSANAVGASINANPSEKVTA